MQTRMVLALGALFCMTGAPALAQGAGEHKFYVGLDVGQSKLDGDRSSVWEQFDDTSTAFTLRAGYRFSRHFSLEGGFTDLGDFEGTVNMACPAVVGVACPSFHSKTSIQGVVVNAVGTWPLAKHFELNASAGAIYQKQTTTLTPVDAPSSSGSETGTIMKFGVGLGFPLNDKMGISLDWTRYRSVGLGFTSSSDEIFTVNEGESSVISLGVNFRL